MTIIVFKATTYNIRFWQFGELYYNGDKVQTHAVVWLQGSSGGQNYELNVYFMKAGSNPPDPNFKPDVKRGAIYLPFEEMSTFMNLLHNDSMIQIRFDTSNTSKIEVSTDIRPLG